MAIPDLIYRYTDELTGWRHDLHAHPETAYQEEYTSDFVAAKLQSFGIEVHRGLGKTGVVGTLKGRGACRASIGLRADMDALDILELNDLPYKSKRPGKMHACGHDGHTTMLLGAARYLAESENFDGTVYFIFQPAEENEAGAKRMIDDGLFERFPADRVFAVHNWPGLPVGNFAGRPGPAMAACDLFEIDVLGSGCHAAMPHLGVDPIVIVAQLISTLQTIASRFVDPKDPVVVTITQVHGGDTWNVIPEKVNLRGTVRTLRTEVQDAVENRLKKVVVELCATLGATAKVNYMRRYPATINDAAETATAAEVARGLVGAEHVSMDRPASMGAEDFSFMLGRKPGCYMFIGNGSAQNGCLLHNPRYDFNDEIIPLGVAYFAGLVERYLPAKG